VLALRDGTGGSRDGAGRYTFPRVRSRHHRIASGSVSLRTPEGALMIRSRPLAIIAIVATMAASGCANPRAMAQLNEQLNQAADAVNDIRITMGDMQGTIDSLRTQLAKQDTIITRLANAAGIQITK
jgi:hypothetical protein